MNLKNFAQTWKYHLIVLISAILTIVIGGYIRSVISSEDKSEASVLRRLQTEVQQLRSSLRRNELKVIEEDIAETTGPVLPRVVSIVGSEDGQPAPAVVTLTDTLPEPVRYSSRNAASTPVISGLLLDAEGHIVTSSEATAKRFLFTFEDGKQRSAVLLSRDADEHLALLKLQETDGLPATRGIEAVGQPQTGGWLIRLGRGVDGRQSISMGLLTAVRRDFAGRDNYLLDVDFAPELAGGPAIDLDGRIVGINLLGESRGITLPIDRALQVIEKLKSRAGRPPRSSIGIEMQELTEGMKRYLAVERGGLITRVIPGSAAERAGLQPMDVVIGLDGQPVTSASAFIEKVQDAEVGARISLLAKRAGTDKTIQIQTTAIGPASPPVESAGDFGLRLFRERTQDGVRITEVRPGTPAQKLGLQPGDRILSVNQRPVRGAADFESIAGSIKADQMQLWLVRRGEQTFCVTIGEAVKVL